MALGALPAGTVAELVAAHLVTHEDAGTRALMRRLAPVRARGHLERAELEAACRWKSPRVIRHVLSNSPASIRRATAAALATRDEVERAQRLVALRGVSVPMASAILTLVEPRRYGVLDIRVWQLLHGKGAVVGAPGGTGLTIGHWCSFLDVVRGVARTLRVSTRAVERTLYALHVTHQAGRLYRDANARRAERLAG
ncbi:MAG: hypothetical protein U0Q12_24095 [Vicinamibacterales bacterium]